MSFVLDGSITGSWCFKDEQNAATDIVLGLLYRDEALVPAIWPAEVANLLQSGIKRQRLTVHDAQTFLHWLESTPVSVQAPSDDMNKMLSSAIAHSLTVYDATYVDLAFQRGIPLASKDKAMRNAATKLGVPVLPQTLPDSI